ncbi:aldehyde dehydrogenase family protein [Streptomyces chiangmaiensis]|uniref:aldehyde dehydrogenase family protein n=1 Tax=Streptomyces chiangmaiensis TaxID=766497 RepID=UPI0033843D76
MKLVGIDPLAKAPLADGDVFIGGRWLPAAGGRTYSVHDPATGALVREVSAAGPDDARAAIEAAQAAAAPWRTTPPRRRSEILHDAFRLLREHTDMLAGLIVLENGKAYRDAAAEVGYAAEFFRWFAEEAVRIGSSFGDAPGGGFRHVVRRHPVGVTAFVTPWNFPAAMATRKIAPALAAGCPVLLKPAPQTPLTALAVAALLTEAGLPEGLLNVLPTDRAPEVVSTWLGDERVCKFSFTGSTATGKLLLEQAGGQRRRRDHGARRQRPLRRLRGRGRRRRRTRRDGCQDARRRGLHRRQPVLRPHRRRGRVHREVRRRHGGRAHRPRDWPPRPRIWTWPRRPDGPRTRFLTGRHRPRTLSRSLRGSSSRRGPAASTAARP